MLPKSDNPEIQKEQLDFYRNMAKKTITIIDPENKGMIVKEEVSYIMRYCLQFPSEAQVRDHIIPELEQDEPSKHVPTAKVEEVVTQSLMKNEYEPAPAERLLAAFRILDPQGTGKIPLDVIDELLTTKGIPFRDQEIDEFKLYAQDKTGTCVEYEDYVAKLIDENERHKEYLLQDWYAKQNKR